jgi:hypothetical protein
MVVLQSSVEWSWTHGGSCQRDGLGGPGHHHDGQGCVGRHQVCHTLVMVVLVIIKMVMAVILVIVVLVMLVHTPLFQFLLHTYKYFRVESVKVNIVLHDGHIISCRVIW